jgi:hypothetical protein
LFLTLCFFQSSIRVDPGPYIVASPENTYPRGKHWEAKVHRSNACAFYVQHLTVKCEIALTTPYLGRISFRLIWNMFHFIVPENKIMICCFKKRYASKLCFRKSETCFHQMNNTMFHETLKDGLQKACCICSCSSLYIHKITEHILYKISLPC